MAWKPWYERMVEMDTADEREAFVRGVFGGPKPPSAGVVAGSALTALMVGWGVNRIVKSVKK